MSWRRGGVWELVVGWWLPWFSLLERFEGREGVEERKKWSGKSDNIGSYQKVDLQQPLRRERVDRKWVAVGAGLEGGFRREETL